MKYFQGWEFFKGISFALFAMLQFGIQVRQYHYMEKDPHAKQTTIQHFMMLQQ
jgi:hypothetical protein